jgi:hypothetical protein
MKQEREREREREREMKKNILIQNSILIQINNNYSAIRL